MIEASEILGVEEFTTTVTLPDATTVEGIFDSASENAGIGIGISAPNPTIVVADAVAAALNEGDRLTIDSTVYRICGPFESDGEGLTTINLHT